MIKKPWQTLLIKVFSILLIIFGILMSIGTVNGLIMFLQGKVNIPTPELIEKHSYSYFLWEKSMSSHLRGFYIRWLIYSLLILVCGIGMLRLKNWARMMFVALLIWGMFSNVLNIVKGLRYGEPASEVINIGFVILFFLLPLVIIYFFTRPTVKEQFKCNAPL